MQNKSILFAILLSVCAISSGCVKEVNSPSAMPPEEKVSSTDTPSEAKDADEPAVALPAPEFAEGGKDGTVVPQQPPAPVVPPTADPLKQPDYAPLTADKWDVKLPEPELKPGDPQKEQSPEVEQKLAKALNDINSGRLDFLVSYHEDPAGVMGGGSVKSPSVASKRKTRPAPAKVMMMADSSPMEAVQSSSNGTMIMGMPSSDEMPMPDMNTDEYSQFDPNRFINTAANPLSTFGADVDTASYGVFRRSVNDGEIPRNRGLRVEEMVNYFKYDYPNPKAGEPFSVTTEIAGCPWNKDTKLLLVGAKTRDLSAEERPASNIVFLLDTSGSMSSLNKLALIKASLLSMLPKLTAQDKISIVTYSGHERFIIDAVPGDHHATIMKALSLFDAYGSTNGEAGIQMAYAVAKKNYIKGGNNRIILGTDGDLNVGISSTNELKALIEKKRESGIFLSVLGVGMGNYKDNRLEALADYGNGSYHYIDSLREGKRVLVDEFMSTVFVVAKDVKFQVDFNPGKIKGYRQIGYETRKLNAEDFADDKKDGGEVGAGHQVTILYEIVEEGSPVEVPEPSSKYQKVEAVASDEYATVKLRYKKPDGDVSSELSWPVTSKAVSSKMSANLNFASAVAATAMILNDSAFKGTATYDSVLTQLKDISSLDEDEYRAEFVTLVRRLKGL